MIRSSSPSSLTSVPDHLPNSTRSPAFTPIGIRSPFSLRAPGPTARTSPCIGFSLAVSGMMIPPLVFCSSSMRLTTTRSCSGRNFIAPSLGPALRAGFWHSRQWECQSSHCRWSIGSVYKHRLRASRAPPNPAGVPCRRYWLPVRCSGGAGGGGSGTQRGGRLISPPSSSSSRSIRSRGRRAAAGGVRMMIGSAGGRPGGRAAVRASRGPRVHWPESVPAPHPWAHPPPFVGKDPLPRPLPWAGTELEACRPGTAAGWRDAVHPRGGTRDGRRRPGRTAPVAIAAHVGSWYPPRLVGSE